MIKILSTYQTDNTHPFRNLAVEEYLLHKVKPEECILYLWQNKNTVVIGKNQNSWRECKVEELEKNDGHLVRRLSGGGAVYHDLGNLNFTFLIQKENYDVAKQLQVIVKALETFGVVATVSGRNDITVDGKKFSGNAYYRSGNTCYHHGTLLVNSDLEHMSHYLNVSAEKMSTNGVSSVRARVCNLNEMNPAITITSLSKALITALGEVYDGMPQFLSEKDFDSEMISTLEDKFASWDWRFGRPIHFQNECSKRFSWGEIQLHFTVSGGFITDAKVFSDAMNTELIPLVNDALIGSAYDSSIICSKINALQGEDPMSMSMIADICSLLQSSIQ